jgi:predicted RND superfamily exporter protein
MLSSAIIRIVDFCVQRRWQVVVFGILLAVASAIYDVRRFSITTDTDGLISEHLPWHQRQSALSKAFPQKGILVVVTAATPENAEQATNALEHELSKHPDLFHSVVQADSGEFFQHNGLLFEPLSEVRKSIDGLSRAKSPLRPRW